MRLRSLFLPLLGLVATLVSAAPAPLPCKPDQVVAADGSGDFKTVQAAVAAIPADNRERVVIFIKNGTYHEKVRIDARCVTLRGESRDGTRIEFPQGREEYSREQDKLGFAVVNIHGDDCVLENLTIENTHGVIGKHAFAVYGSADRTVITDCNVYSQGNDTLSLWQGDTGRYYHARLKIRGSVDFVCPRGWCYMADCELFEVNPGAHAAIWHDGSRHQDQKFVMRNVRFDGVENWRFARHHVDAQFYLVDCTFSSTMRDLKPGRVLYPTNGGTPSDADLKRNRDLDAQNRWGERFYYSTCHRAGGDFAWHADNLATALGSPKPEQITAKWTFAGTWDPENTAGPTIKDVKTTAESTRVVFSESVTVKGHPLLVLKNSARATYQSGSGTDTLVFSTTNDMPLPVALDPNGGAIVATEAAATLRPAQLNLPTR